MSGLARAGWGSSSVGIGEGVGVGVGVGVVGEGVGGGVGVGLAADCSTIFWVDSRRASSARSLAAFCDAM